MNNLPDVINNESGWVDVSNPSPVDCSSASQCHNQLTDALGNAIPTSHVTDPLAEFDVYQGRNLSFFFSWQTDGLF